MRRLFAGFACLLLVSSGCGGPDTPRSTPGQPDRVKVGVITIVDVAPIYLGKAKGFFSSRDIDLALEAASGGNVTISGVMSGQYQFGFANVTSVLIARQQGLPIRVVANGVMSTGLAGKDFSGVVVKADSPIRSAKDLAGRTVSVNNVKNIGDTTIRASIRKDGGDPTSMRFVELPFPDAPAAVSAGRVDAAWVVEPFLTAATGQGMRVVSWNMVDTWPRLTVAAYVTQESTERENPDLVRRFTEAMNESLDYADSHPDEVRDILGSYTQIAADARTRITLPGWSAQINRASIEQTAALARQDGLISDPADVNGFLPPR